MIMIIMITIIVGATDIVVFDDRAYVLTGSVYVALLVTVIVLTPILV